VLRVGANLPDFRRAQALTAAADYEEVFGSNDRALEHGETAVRIMMAMPPAEPNSTAGMTLGGALLSLGRARARCGLLAEALESYSAAVPVFETAVQRSPEHALARRNLHLNHVWIGDLLASDDRFNLGRLEEAERHFLAAIGIAEQMVASDPKNEVASVDLARAAGKLGSAIYRTRPAQSLELMNRAHELLAKTSLGNTSAAEMQLAYLLESTRPLTRLGRVAEAQANVDSAASRLEELRRQNPTRDWTRNMLAIHAARGRVFDALGQYANALESAKQELLLIERQTRPQHFGDDYSLVDALERVVQFGLHADRAAAGRAQQRLVEIWSHWSKRFPASTYVAGRLDRARSGVLRFLSDGL
jgi:tetratricopeptide (TPR) repeat protein